jgi:pimeloyl-ACP methyl ester carboxylesterase
VERLVDLEDEAVTNKKGGDQILSALPSIADRQHRDLGQSALVEGLRTDLISGGVESGAASRDFDYRRSPLGDSQHGKELEISQLFAGKTMKVRIPTIFAGAALSAAVVMGPLAAQQPTEKAPAYGPELEGFDYPFPVQHFAFTSQRQSLQMAYLDVKPDRPNGQTAVLLHGKNFCAATWEPTIKDLVAAGYRVIALDQIGFCKSSKPAAYQFTFKQLAGNTHELLAKLGIEKPVVVGHSTGGMLAAHYALIYPKDVSHLVLVNPVGLEDWSAKGVPPISVDQWYARELKTNADGIRAYEKSTYYAGKWEDRYERAVDMLAGLNSGPGKEAVAWDSALIYDMIITQPVVYRFGEISAPTLLMIGQKDTTAIAKDFAPPELRSKLGNYPELGKAAAKAIPGAKLVEFPEFGHAPQMTDPEGFDKALIAGISKS